MSRFGIWLNQRNATLVQLDGEGDEAQTQVEHLTSDVESHHKTTGGTRGRAPFVPRSGAAGESRKQDGRREHELHTFFKQILLKVKKAEAIAIFGPGTVKSRLEKMLQADKDVRGDVRSVQKADKMTEKQIVARTRKVFGVSAERKLPRIHGASRPKTAVSP